MKLQFCAPSLAAPGNLSASCAFLHPNPLSLPKVGSTSRPLSHADYKQTNAVFAFSLSPATVPQASLLTAIPFNSHNASPQGRLPSNGCIGRAPHQSQSLPAHLLWAASDTALKFVPPCAHGEGLEP
jgi:hypothetical protein